MATHQRITTVATTSPAAVPNLKTITTDPRLSALAVLVLAITVQAAGCADSGTGRDVACPDCVSPRDAQDLDSFSDSTVGRDAFMDGTVRDVADNIEDLAMLDINDAVEFLPCTADSIECGLNETCLMGKDSVSFCECLPPFNRWDNVVLPDEPVELDYYRLVPDAICLRQMPDEYFSDLPNTWWDEDGELYGYPDDEGVIIEPVFILYDQKKRVLLFGQDETEFTLREDGIAINLVTMDDGRTGWVYLLKLTKTRAVMNTFDWPSGKLTLSWALVP